MRKNKVVLVNPPQYTRYPQPPMGLAIIAAILEKEGYQVKILDANALNLDTESIIPFLSDANVVGLTAMTPTVHTAVSIANDIKQAKPNITVILGGVHGTLLPEETLNTTPGIDVIVRGEGEHTICELLDALENNKALDTVQGITFRKDGKIASNPSRTDDVDLDSLPFLAYHMLPWQKYKPHPPHGRALPFTAIITSRGCPYRCAYCSKPVFGNKFIAQSPERVLDEITYHKNKFGVGEIAFYDDVFTMNKNRAHAIADGMMQKGLKILWTCETRVNLVDRELLRHIKQAGCYAIAYGIESASQEILDSLNKGITLEQVEEAVRITHEAGLQTIGYFMIGSPGESPETINKTIQFAKKLKLDFAQFAITTPFPGTKLYELFSSYKKGNISWKDFVYDGAGTHVTPVFENDELGRTDLQYWAGKAYKEFYMRPSYVWQRARKMKSMRDLQVNIKGLGMLLGNIKPVRKL